MGIVLQLKGGGVVVTSDRLDPQEAFVQVELGFQYTNNIMGTYFISDFSDVTLAIEEFN